MILLKSTFRLTALRSVLLVVTIFIANTLKADEPCQPFDSKLVADKSLLIGEVKVRTNNIFDLDDPKQDSKINKLMNKWHRVTRPHVVRKKLLFKAGDEYNPEKLAESERLLRAANYIKDAEITPEQICDGKVIIRVETRDNWTLTPGVSYGRSGGNNKTGIAFEEHNLLGLGKSLSLSYRSTFERDSVTLDYRDDQLLGSRKTLDIGIANNSDGHKYSLNLASPFYALDTQRAWQIGLSDSSSTTSIFDQGVVSDTFSQDEQNLALSYGWNKESNEKFTSRYQLGWHYEKSRREDASNSITERQYSYPWVGYEFLQSKYLERENFNTMGRKEDVAIGKRLSFQLGLLSKELGNDDDQLKLSTSVSGSFIHADPQLGLYNFTAQTYLGQGDKQGVEAQLNAQYHYLLDENDSLFFKTSLKAADNFLDDQQYRLGSIFDLRGYPEGFQTGNKSVNVTAEYRHFFEQSPYKLVKFGAAAFVDAGTAWTSDSSPDWVSDVGLGLRLVPTRSSSGKIVHIDLAYPFDTQGGAKDVQFTVGTKSTF